MGMYIEGLDKQVQKGAESITVTFWDKDELIINEYDIGDMSKVTDLDLVRCEECKHKPIKYDPEGDDFGFNLVSPNGYDNLCPCLNTDDGFYSYMPEDNFFCAFGERRADEHTD